MVEEQQRGEQRGASAKPAHENALARVIEQLAVIEKREKLMTSSEGLLRLRMSFVDTGMQRLTRLVN
jgi:hypothetical protein